VDVATAPGPVAEAFAARQRAWEDEHLSPLAAHSYPARRRVPEPDCGLRTPLQRDRDRIVHSKAFRRLKHKTQVFVAPEGDHYRTRLTHTLEAVGISRTVARALRLNEDLTESIGLGHDLGHPPFGHAGEAALDAALRERFERGFRHNEHSLRVVDVLEREGRGLNLTHEVRNGILNHTGPVTPESLEGRIVKLVDRVAYINHDIDDALRAGVLGADELPEGPVAMLGATGSARIDAIVHDLVETSDAAGDIRQSEPFGEAMLALRAFLFERVYGQGPLRAEAERAAFVVRSLFAHFCEHPGDMDDGDPPVDLATRVTDHVAGMTDRFALRRFEQLLLPLAQAGP
jgi:dGTPase